MSLRTQNATSERYAEANAPLTALLDTVPADRWDRPSPCEEWVARDVVRHLIQTQRDFLTGRGFAFGGDVDVDVDVDVDADPASAWRAHARAVGDLLARPEVAATEYDGYFGPTTVGHTVGQFYIPDMVVHRWDIASAVDADPTLTDDELDRTEASIDSWGEAMYTAGICKPAVVPLAGTSRQTVLLARMGRRAW